MLTSEQIAKVIHLKYPTKSVYITQIFGINTFFDYTVYGLNGHNGIDLRAATKTPVYAVYPGTITQVYNGDPTDTTKGRYVKYQTDEFTCEGERMKLEFVYFHLWSSELEVGDRVNTGDLIGLADNTGKPSSGSHLHFGVYPLYWDSGRFAKFTNNGYGGAIDPKPLFTNEYTMTFKKEKDSPHIYLIVGNKKIMIVDMPTLNAIRETDVEEVDSLAQYFEDGTLVWCDRIIN